MRSTILKLPHPKLHKLKSQLLPSLNEEQRVALHLRFWESLSILEITRVMKKSWDQTDVLIESTLDFLNTELTKREPSLEQLVA